MSLSPGKAIRFYSRLLIEVARKHTKLLLVGVVLGLPLPLLIPKLSSSKIFQPPRTIGIIGQPPTNTLPTDIAELVSQGLTSITSDGRVVPSLAKEWEEKENSKKFVFHLSPDLKWQDKSPVTASDIRYAFRDVEIATPDDKTIEFTLKDSYVPFPSAVSRVVYKHQKSSSNPVINFFKNKYIGTGKYKLARIRTNGQFITEINLKALEDNLPNLRYRYYPTEDAAIIAFKLGEIREIRDLSNPHSLTSRPDVTTSGQSRNDRYVALLFNTQRDPFSDKSFRQGLAYAIDKNASPNRSIGPISPNSWAFNSELKLYTQDLGRATSLLKKYTNSNLNIEISTFSWLLDTAERVKTDWQKIGINSTIKVVNDIPDEYDVLIAWQTIPADPDQYSLWHSTQPTNITRFKNPKIDKLLEDGRRTSDLPKRLTIYQDFQRFLVEESPAVFLYHPISYTIIRNT